MEKRLDHKSFFHGRTPSLPNERPTVRVSISTSLSPRSPEIVRTPPSPAKSSAGAVMDESQFDPFRMENPYQTVSPLLPELDRHPPLRHPQHDYHRNTILEPHEKLLQGVSNRVSHFSADSDSSGVAEVEPNEVKVLETCKSWKRRSEALASPIDGSPTKPVTRDSNTQESTTPKVQGLETMMLERPRPRSVVRNIAAAAEDHCRSSLAKDVKHDTAQTVMSNSTNDTTSRPVSDLENLYRRYVGNALTSATHGNTTSFIPPYHGKGDCILGIHSITMQALRRADADLMELHPTGDRLSRNLESFGSFQAPFPDKPRSILRNPGFAYTGASKHRSSSSPALTSSMKKVSMVPAIIPNNTQDIAPDYVRTPYPIDELSTNRLNYPPTTATHTLHVPHAKPRMAPPIPSILPIQDSIVFLSVRRRAAKNSQRRLTISITIPNERRSFTSTLAEKRLTAKKFPFIAADFDDATLFTLMRTAYYHELLGAHPLPRLFRRWCSARTLVAIVVVPYQRRGADDAENSGALLGYNTMGLAPASRQSAQTLEKPLSEKSLLMNFGVPDKVRSQYRWVQWSHEAARASRAALTGYDYAMGGTLQLPPEVPGPQLEFVEGWSVWRILAVGLGVMTASVAGLLLWTFLGGGSGALGADGGRSRLLTGIVFAVLLALFGGIGMVLWLGLSWIVM